MNQPQPPYGHQPGGAPPGAQPEGYPGAHPGHPGHPGHPCHPGHPSMGGGGHHPLGPTPSAMGPGGPAGYGVPGYEFTHQQNSIIDKAATWSKGLAIMLFIEAFLQLVNINLIMVLVYAGVGVSFWKAGTSLRSVVETQGNDVPHLMEALSQVGTALLIRLILMGVAVALLVLGVAIGVAVVLAN